MPTTVQFAEFIRANIQLYLMKNNTDLGPKAVASFVRGEVARSLRSRNAYQVNLLLGGVDPITEKASMYWIDYLATMTQVTHRPSRLSRLRTFAASVLTRARTAPRNRDCPGVDIIDFDNSCWKRSGGHCAGWCLPTS